MGEVVRAKKRRKLDDGASLPVLSPFRFLSMLHSFATLSLRLLSASLVLCFTFPLQLPTVRLVPWLPTPRRFFCLSGTFPRCTIVKSPGL